MKYEVYVVSEDSSKEYGPKIGDVRVRFPDIGEDYCTELDENGQRHFGVPNIIRPDSGEGRIHRLFIGRIKDAYEAIVQGHGDVIGTSQIFGPLGFRSENVRKYIDREYGEALRQKTLEGWKDAVFGFNVVFGYNDSMQGPRPLCEDDTLFSPLAGEDQKIRFFETEEEAQKYLDEKMSIAQPMAKEYTELEDELRSMWLKTHFITRHDHMTIIWELFYAMSKEKLDEEEKKFTFEIRQAVKI